MAVHSKRLGRNLGGYFGETITIESALVCCLQAAREYGWRTEMLEVSPGLELIALRREGRKNARKLFISAGMHGDEPAGPLAIWRLLKQNRWPDDIDLWVYPCLNPTGFQQNQRENKNGVDLNRQYHLPPDAEAEVKAHVQWLKRQPRFDAAICLHEDWESNGFYVYDLGGDASNSMVRSVLAAVEKVCPIDRSNMIDGMPARDGIMQIPENPKESMTEWPEAFYLLEEKTSSCFTFEAPSDFPLLLRVSALVRAVMTVAEELSAGSGQ